MQSSMMPFTLSELVTLSRCLRDACLGIIKLAYPETKAEHREEYMAAFRSVGVKTNTEVQQRIQAEQKRWVQLFKIFQRLISVDKRDVQGDGPFPDGINVTIRRNYIYEDAYDKLSPENETDLKKRIRVHLLNAHGLDEAGIDGGGIFREFLNELLKSGFNPNQGFFKTTNEGLLYPNPAADMLVGESFTRHYYFLGRILGKGFYESPARLRFLIALRVKALYENMLVELPFASFFLSKLLGTSADVDIHHLASLDPEMYRNLLFLKSYEGDVEELGLNFTVVNNDLGEAQLKAEETSSAVLRPNRYVEPLFAQGLNVVELKPGGKDIPVTTANRIAYIHLVADYRLNKQIRPHCLAFRQGLANVVNLEWLRMFDQQEIQELYPAFCIHNGGSDLERLPTASTCMNLLKLPEFCDQHLMRSKLLYAIESSAGFELS
ncbi:hypothetical protein GOODEAATRI_002497 [Goodea atripinnis]|uniref:HECT-type E3 ubiquitin transferase n=1 Tax=Goodea atripinnis TaxID=208336 RepID=A0ABV0NR65_9TELE